MITQSIYYAQEVILVISYCQATSLILHCTYLNFLLKYNMSIIFYTKVCVLNTKTDYNFLIKFASRCHLRGTKFQNFPGGMPPDPPSNSMLCMLSVLCTLSVEQIVLKQVIHWFDQIFSQNRTILSPARSNPTAILSMLMHKMA